MFEWVAVLHIAGRILDCFAIFRGQHVPDLYQVFQPLVRDVLKVKQGRLQRDRVRIFRKIRTVFFSFLKGKTWREFVSAGRLLIVGSFFRDPVGL